MNCEPTVAELFRLDEILSGEMPALRFQRLWAAYAVRFGWPFCGDDGQWDDDAESAWKRWAGLEVEYSL